MSNIDDALAALLGYNKKRRWVNPLSPEGINQSLNATSNLQVGRNVYEPGGQQAAAAAQQAAARQAQIVASNNQQAQEHAQQLQRQQAAQNDINKTILSGNILPGLPLKGLPQALAPLQKAATGQAPEGVNPAVAANIEALNPGKDQHAINARNNTYGALATNKDPWEVLKQAGVNYTSSGEGTLDNNPDRAKAAVLLLHNAGIDPTNVVVRKLVKIPDEQKIEQQVGGNTDPAAIQAAKDNYYRKYAAALVGALQNGNTDINQAKDSAYQQVAQDPTVSNPTVLQAVRNEQLNYSAQDKTVQAQTLAQQIVDNLNKTKPAEATAKKYSSQVQNIISKFGTDPGRAIDALSQLVEKTKPSLIHPDLSNKSPQLQAQAQAWNEQLLNTSTGGQQGKQQQLEALGIQPQMALVGGAGALALPRTVGQAASGLAKGVAGTSALMGSVNALDAITHGQNIPQAFIRGATNPQNLSLGAVFGLALGGRGAKTPKPVEPGIATQAEANSLKSKIDKISEAQQSKIGRLDLMAERLKAANPENNPLMGTYKPDVVKPGDYRVARVKEQAAPAPLNDRAAQAYMLTKSLSKSDKVNFPHYVEGTLPIPNAKVAEAVKAVKDMTDTSHAIKASFGDIEPYLQKFWMHNWDLSNPKQAATFKKLAGAWTGRNFVPGKQRPPRIFRTVQEGNKFRFNLKNPGKPENDILAWAKQQSSRIQDLAFAKYAPEADRLIENGKAIPKPTGTAIETGGGGAVPLSREGARQFISRTYKPNQIVSPKFPVAGKLLSGYRTAVQKPRTLALSLTQFHNLRIARNLASQFMLRGRPDLAAQALVKPLLAEASPKYARRLQRQRIESGLSQKSAEIGMPYGLSPISYGRNDPLSSSHNLVFGKAMPALQDLVAKYGLSRLERTSPTDKILGAVGINRKPVSLSSPEALNVGKVGLHELGFLDKAGGNISPGLTNLSSDVLFGGSYRPSRWSLLADTKQKGIAGSMARSAVISNYLGDVLTGLGIGAAAGQNSDNLKDTLIRAAIDPGIPLPIKDNKGNDIELKLPASFTSELLRLGFEMGRDKSGRITVKFNPTWEKIAQYGRSTLNIFPAWALRTLTNKDYFGNPIRSNSTHTSLLTKVEQTAADLAKNALPIPLQQFNQKGLLGLGAGIVGLRPAVDQTRGRGLMLSQLYKGRDASAKPLTYGVGDTDPDTGKKIKNQAEADRITKHLQAEFDLSTDAKKADWGNPDWERKTGYTLLANALKEGVKGTEVINAIRDFYKSAPNHDPLWDLPNDRLWQVSLGGTFNKGTTDPAEKSFLSARDQSPWYKQFIKDRQAYYAKLPIGSAPQSQEISPQAPPSLDQYNPNASSADKAAFLKAHPEVPAYFNAASNYTTNVRSGMGLPPEITGQQQASLNQFEGLQQGGVGPGTSMTGKTASTFIKAHPELGTLFNFEKAAKAQESALGGGTPSSSGSGFSRVRRRGGKRISAGKTIRIKKGRAGKKVTFKKNKITPFVLPKTKKKSLTFQQILKQLS